MVTALWFATRAAGIVSLLLLTAVTVLGISTAGAQASPRWPRLVTSGLHRNLSLLSVAFLGVHIAATVVDGYVPVDAWDVLLPFGSDYEPFWLGLGALAVDLVIALVVTSLLRRRLSPALWRGLHWTAYACWLVAVVHAVGAGTDRMLTVGLGIACAAMVFLAAGARFGRGRREVYA